ncbi:MAG: HAD family hydrolase [Thermoguttaceae bacterium]|nr:HAD family hydrolase [Thermoguttaceae bacterium]
MPSQTVQSFTDYFFDLDGTTLDTYGDLRSCMKAALQKYTQDVDRFETDFVIGPPLQMSVKMFLPAANEATIDNICREFKTQYDTSDYPETKMYPGIEALINRLYNSGKRIHIVTNKRRVPTFRLLDKFGLRDKVVEVVTPDSRPDGYTKTEMIQMLLEKYSVNPDTAVMVGDMTSDVYAGKSAGVHTIAVTWGYGSEDALKESQPDKVISSVDDFWL